MESIVKVKVLFIIVNAGYTGTVMDIVRAEGASGATILNARGEGARRESFMGITVEPERELIMTIVGSETAKRITAARKEKAGRKSTLRGIRFAMPVDRIVGIYTTSVAALERPGEQP